MSGELFNGWANYETWNVALWLDNDQGLHHIACEKETYAQVVEELKTRSRIATPDGVSYTDAALDVAELDELVREAT